MRTTAKASTWRSSQSYDSGTMRMPTPVATLSQAVLSVVGRKNAKYRSTLERLPQVSFSLHSSMKRTSGNNLMMLGAGIKRRTLDMPASSLSSSHDCIIKFLFVHPCLIRCLDQNRCTEAQNKLD